MSLGFKQGLTRAKQIINEMLNNDGNVHASIATVIRNGDLRTLKKLLDTPDKIDETWGGHNGYTPLQLAAIDGQVEIC